MCSAISKRKWTDTMDRAIRIQCYQELANYRKPSSFIIKETFPLPPYSTVLGMVHAACGFKEFHPMKLSIQGTNNGTVSELYTRYSFTPGGKFEKTRHQICIKDGKEYGIFKGIANVELICENRMVIHVVPSDEDFDTVYHALCKPQRYPSLGRYEDMLDIERVDIVSLEKRDEAFTEMDIYVPVDSDADTEGTMTTIYTLTKEYEITKKGLRRWKAEGGKIKAKLFPANESIGNVYVDDFSDPGTVVVLA